MNKRSPTEPWFRWPTETNVVAYEAQGQEPLGTDRLLLVRWTDRGGPVHREILSLGKLVLDSDTELTLARDEQCTPTRALFTIKSIPKDWIQSVTELTAGTNGGGP